MRVAIVGGPGIGKSTLVRQLGDPEQSPHDREGGHVDPRSLTIPLLDDAVEVIGRGTTHASRIRHPKVSYW